MKTTHNVPLKALCLTLGVHFNLGRQCKGTKKSNRFTHFSPLVIEMSVTLLHFAVYQCATKPNFGV